MADDGNNDKSVVPDDDVSLGHVCRLLQIDRNEFAQWLTKRQIVTRGEKFIKDLRVDMAIVIRDSVAKFM